MSILKRIKKIANIIVTINFWAFVIKRITAVPISVTLGLWRPTDGILKKIIKLFVTKTSNLKKKTLFLVH